MEATQRASLQPTDASSRNGRASLSDKVTCIDMSCTFWPDQRFLRISSTEQSLLGHTHSCRYKAGEIKGAELHVGDGNIEWSKFGSQDLSEGRKCGANSRLGSVKRWVNGRDDRWREDEDLWRDPFLAYRLQA